MKELNVDRSVLHRVIQREGFLVLDHCRSENKCDMLVMWKGFLTLSSSPNIHSVLRSDKAFELYLPY